MNRKNPGNVFTIDEIRNAKTIVSVAYKISGIKQSVLEFLVEHREYLERARLEEEAELTKAKKNSSKRKRRKSTALTR